MVGIVSYGAYVPLHRLGPGTRGWMAQTEKAVASWDEDSLTMAVEAALDCIGNSDRNQIDGRVFCLDDVSVPREAGGHDAGAGGRPAYRHTDG